MMVALWLFPLVVFPNPRTNDAIWLANLDLLVLLVGAVGVVVAIIRGGQRRAAVCVELGVYLVGVAAAFLLGFAVFGNNSDDRFLPLLFLPPFIAAPGLLLVVVGLLLRGDRRELLGDAAYGAVAAGVLAAWVLVRGARDWLLAPYGFDEVAVIIVIGVAARTFRPALRG